MVPKHESDLVVQADLLLVDHQPFHTELQLNSFVVSKCGYQNDWGMHKQAIREVDARRTTLLELISDLEDMNIDCRELINDRKIPFTRARRLINERLKVKLGRLERAMATKHIALDECKRELEILIYSCRELSEKIGPLTEAKRRSLDEEFWVHRIKTEIGLQILSGGKVSADMIGAIMSVPEHMQFKLSQYIEDPKNAAIDIINQFGMMATINRFTFKKDKKHVPSHTRRTQKPSRRHKTALQGSCMEDTANHEQSSFLHNGSFGEFETIRQPDLQGNGGIRVECSST